MPEVILSEYIFPTEDKHIFEHGYKSGEALQYYGGNTGVLIHWTPNYHRIISCESVNVDTQTPQCFSPMQNPYFKDIQTKNNIS